ncbi:hypothetical protein Pla110_46380 [Polystyrenella longa]|uniref:FHA domain-containing protein n=1 Tax=Polystyrenella longa TaxID=2528007 RepID=A0A518CUI0_9PLAN|nr:FHA domain-containing protein [Polystyrenella longa]QDU82875.1 hypothetical protein Pla110_46380 [Polystyrenella longa]
MKFTRGDSSRQDDAGSSPAGKSQLPDRLMLWVDQVGGYLICLKEEVSLGAVTGGAAEVDIPVMANLSRQHATIHRRGETYLVSAQGPTFLEGRPVEYEAYLSSNSQLKLAGVEFRFRQPTVLSATAVLDPLTSHRIAEGAEGIVLMEGLCLLGPATDHHIVCRHWTDPIILFRRGDQLLCKSPGPLFVDEELVQEEAIIQHGNIIAGTESRFRVEYC